MNLKYYLRGLGVGFIVCALILGIHHFRKNDSVMTDDQIKARAEQLGMVEASQRLTDKDVPDAEELLQSIDEPTPPEKEEIPAAPAAKEAPAAEIPAAPAAGSKPGLEDTMVMPMPHIDEPADWMDAGTVAQTAAAAGKPLSAKELKKLEKEKEKEAKRLAKEEKRAASAAVETYTPEDVQTKSKGGAGRVILMIILIILCLIFALELAGIGIKLLAPTSGAAEYIDNILNSIIHMITG